MKCVAANGRVGSVNKENAITQNEPGDALGKFRYRNVSAVPPTDPPEREVVMSRIGALSIRTDKTGHLLEDMLTLARADAGYADAVFEPVELTELVEDVRARLRRLAEAKDQTMTVRMGYEPVWTRGERSNLRRLLSILIDNAIKYTPSKGRIEVELTTTASRAALTVRDSGIGIPEVLLPRIFDRFVRADPSRAEVSGTGLGLAIAKWIADAHNAALTVQSQEQEGSLFTIEFQLGESSGRGAGATS